MTTFACHLGAMTGPPPIDPDGACCMTAVYSDGRACECWEEVYAPEPTPDVLEGPQAPRASMCHDCAYRPGSPERAELGGDPLDVNVREPFTCHQGMPTLLGYVVPSWCVDGVWRVGAFSVPARLVHDRDNFRPVMRGGQAWKADGTTADICAGWHARVRALEAER